MSEQQDEFSSDLCKLFATCNWSWNTVQHPEFQQFFEKYVPGACLPDCHVLSSPILDHTVEDVIGCSRLESLLLI
jgi:hypothetical protein